MNAEYVESHCRTVDGVTFCDFRGHRYYAPWLCLCCGIEIEYKQWMFGRTCGRCDMGNCQPDHRARRQKRRRMTMDEAQSILVNGVRYDAGHARADIVANAEVSNPEVWCASKECRTHAALNRREIALRT